VGHVSPWRQSLCPQNEGTHVDVVGLEVTLVSPTWGDIGVIKSGGTVMGPGWEDFGVPRSGGTLVSPKLGGLMLISLILRGP